MDGNRTDKEDRCQIIIACPELPFQLQITNVTTLHSNLLDYSANMSKVKATEDKISKINILCSINIINCLKWVHSWVKNLLRVKMLWPIKLMSKQEVQAVNILFTCWQLVGTMGKYIVRGRNVNSINFQQEVVKCLVWIPNIICLNPQAFTHYFGHKSDHGGLNRLTYLA